MFNLNYLKMTIYKLQYNGAIFLKKHSVLSFTIYFFTTNILYKTFKTGYWVMERKMNN